ncbi:ORF6C domain-containing protein [Bacillus thuringiensis]|uniref:Rha family transcriptional regulator n=1 Tax=Bacillus thuringiensis TaxID=1428 RepID=UPI000A3B2502|nr:Rha family transcriptional regulator [Bacillus thuringiensis]MED2125983.1 ORF6C domain-containing protein [Bacillus thuringiensis]MED2148680.1 ORF6C domain-containing protein [Bacillus thuringiensis]MED2170816.1 ORF6C domain-containing protein [Bacillus thuringiensis]MED2475897.1 ORF6C domain-containing protein [Bacillus thuringiensis]MED2577227.1 ORF6C domain-containing protein [Bacillus thuringiensis]
MDNLTVANEKPSNELVFENNGEVVTDSLMVAEMFGKRHDNVKRDIHETISRLDELMQSEEVKEFGIDFSSLKFEECHYKADNGQIYTKHLLNFDAFMLVTMSYTTQKAMLIKMKYINEFNRMKDHIQNQQQIPNDPMSILKVTFDALQGHEQEIKGIKSDIKDLRENAPLSVIECDEISRTVRRLGVSLLGGKQSNAYQDRGVRETVYRDIYGQLYREFGVTSYKAIKRCHLKRASELIDEYNIPIVLSEKINLVNSQIKFSEM